MADVSLPTFTGTINQQYFIEPLGGPQNPISYLDRFPDALYLKTPDSHLLRFMYSLLGPAGVGGLRKNYLLARLIFEDHGLELFDLESFYGAPFRFGRILDETYLSDPGDLLSREEWDRIRAKDARYRSRAIDFLNAARAGNSPEGMRLAARSGLGHDVEIIENYRYLFDVNSDNPMGLAYYGSTTSTEEMIVRPRRETSRTEVQTITVTGDPSGGTFLLNFGGRLTSAIAYNATSFVVQSALSALSNIGVGDVEVTGGPGTVNSVPVFAPYTVTFRGDLSARDVPEIVALSNLSGGTNPKITVTTITGGLDSSDETVKIAPRDVHALQTAVDRLKSVTTIPTIAPGEGLRSRQVWANVGATSEYVEVLRFVSGQPNVEWPTPDAVHWIERNVEKQAPRGADDLQHHYVNFHNVGTVTASSEHLGRFSPEQVALFPFLGAADDDVLVFKANRALADYPNPLTVTNTTDKDVALVQGVYPLDYGSLPGVPTIAYRDEQFWASEEISGGAEVLSIDLGSVQAINYLIMEITRKPVDIEIQYDAVGLGTPVWKTVAPNPSARFDDTHAYTAEQSPWIQAEFNFTRPVGGPVFTRRIRLILNRRSSTLDTFLGGGPWSIEVRNLRIGRNVVA